MYWNNFKLALRNLVRNKVYSALNIFGLAIGLSVVLLIGLWVNYQFSFDRFLPGYKQVYRAQYRLVRNGDKETMQASSLQLAGALKNEIPEIKYAVQTDWMGNHGLVVGEKKIYSEGAMAGEDFFRIFQYPMVHGDPGSVLRDPYSIVLSESIAKSLFGDEDPLNKTVKFNNRDNLKVTGIFRDVPANSSLQFNYVVPFEYYKESEPWVREASTTWDNNSFQTFVALQEGADYSKLQPKLKQIISKYKPEWKVVQAEVFLHPLSDWHLYNDFKNWVPVGFIEYVRLFSIVGLLVLIIACINFMNLTTARSERKAREVGIRKAIGSLRWQLIIQFLVESLLITFIAFVLSLGLVTICLPSFNEMTSSSIRIPFYNAVFWILMISYVMVTGILAGLRPALLLSSFKAVRVLKGSVRTGRGASLSRKILVVTQFSCSVALIISTLIIYKQVRYAKDRPSGYQADRLVMTDSSDDLKQHYEALKNELLATGLVTDVTSASSSATNINSWNGIDEWQGKLPDETLSMATIAIGRDYFKTLGMELKEGREFTGNIGSDSLDVIINEAAAKRLRYSQALNQVIVWHNQQQKIRVVGVVKDALMLSPFSPPEPTFFIFDPGEARSVMYRLSRQANLPNAIGRCTKIFNKYNPSYPYIYHFADESYLEKFSLETLIGKLSGLFAMLAVIVSCLGLFGLAAYMAEQRKKEIGIRKVLGASISQIWLMLSKQFFSLVFISCLIASPVAYYFLSQWLLKYDYRISIGPGIFVLSIAITMVITIMTVSFQAIRAALMNPAVSLKNE